MRFLPFFIFLVVLIGAVEASPSVNIVTPANTTYFTTNVTLNTTSNESLSGRWYSLDGAANVSFSSNVTLNFTTPGQHNITVIHQNTTGTNTTNTSYFTVAFLTIRVYDDDSGNNVSSGIDVALQNSAGTITLQTNTTNGSGESILIPSAYGSYFVRGGGGSGQPESRKIPVTFSSPTQVVDLYLVTGDGGWVNIQIVDNYYNTQISGATVDLYRGTTLINRMTSDSGGYVTDYFVQGIDYQVRASATAYLSTNVTQPWYAGTYAIYLDRISLIPIDTEGVSIMTYPEGGRLDRVSQSTATFGMSIYARECDLTNYGIVVGYNPATIVDSNYPYSTTKRLLKTGTESCGDWIDTTPIDLNAWNSDTVYVGNYYIKTDGVTEWVVNTYRFTTPSGSNAQTVIVKDQGMKILVGMGASQTGAEKTLAYVSLVFVSVAAAAVSRKSKMLGVFIMVGLMLTFTTMDLFNFEGAPWDGKVYVLTIIIGCASLMVDKHFGGFD